MLIIIEEIIRNILLVLLKPTAQLFQVLVRDRVKGRVAAKILLLVLGPATNFLLLLCCCLNFFRMVQTLVMGSGGVEKSIDLLHMDIFFNRLLVQERLLDQGVVLPLEVALEQTRISANDSLQVSLALQFHVFLSFHFYPRVLLEVRVALGLLHALAKVRSRIHLLHWLVRVFHLFNY